MGLRVVAVVGLVVAAVGWGWWLLWWGGVGCCIGLGLVVAVVGTAVVEGRAIIEVCIYACGGEVCVYKVGVVVWWGGRSGRRVIVDRCA